MVVKLTNRRFVEDALKLAELSEKILPIKVSYAISRNLSKMDSMLKVFNKEKLKLIDMYAEKDENGKPKIVDNQYIIKEDCREKWNEDLDTLYDIEVELDVHQFKIEELEGHSMKPSELMLIDYMIMED